MNLIYFVLLLLAAVCFALLSYFQRNSLACLLPLGLLLWVSVSLIQAGRVLDSS